MLVYVPHTTAGVTINEHADPAVARDFEAALERMVDDGWPWEHVEPGEENAPTHVRASLMGPSVVVPLGTTARSLSAPGRGSSSASSTGRATGHVYVASAAPLAMAAPVRKGEELELRIDSLAYGGNGVGRHDGFVVFVRGGLPGDRVARG